MTQDRQGNQVLSQINLDCNEEWSRYLPDLLDEDPTRVEVSVTLGQAAFFLDYEPIKRRLTLETEPRTFDDEGYTVMIQLSDSKGNLVSYIVYVTVQCEIPVFVPKKPKYFKELRYDE